ncbi:Gp49 family protein [Comamonas sp. Z1]|uniref:Gp49 family protein n=1 Tax=Comamonas sp. Z1 TaxID=2601246 RepID=UPI001CA366FB|nr:Gp49 family protein [Comamonas sp. Z1]
MNLSFNTSPKMLLCIAAAILAVLLFCAFKVNTNPSGIALTGFIFCCMALAVFALTARIDLVFRALLEQLEPKTGGATGGTLGSVNATQPYRERSQREDLIQSLVHSLAPGLISNSLINNMKAPDLGTYIREVADNILGSGTQTPTVACTCGPNDGCSNCYRLAVERYKAGLSIAAAAGRVTVGDMEPHLASVGVQADQRAEAEIVAAGLTAPRVTAEQIQGLMAKITWLYEQPAGTTSTLAHAFLGRFYLATGHSACVSPENFNAALGMKYAREQAEGKARDKLWEHEGYALAKSLQVLPS